jgi:hypothetical protein
LPVLITEPRWTARARRVLQPPAARWLCSDAQCL